MCPLRELGDDEQVSAMARALIWDGMQGAKRSNSRSYCEHLQRSRPPETADAHGAVIRAEVPWVAIGCVAPMQRRAKHPHAAHAVAQRNLADLRAVQGKGF